MDELLFADLPIQTAPDTLSCDNGILMKCNRCSGAGQEKCPYPRHYLVAQTWDPTCRKCNGSGWIYEVWK